MEDNRITGFMLEIEMEVLASLAEKVPPGGRLVELGSLFGRSAVNWATARPDIDILCIDEFGDKFWENLSYPGLVDRPVIGKHYKSYELFLDNTRPYPNISHLKCKCPEELTYDGVPIDLLFIDLAHTNPVDWECIEFFMPYLKSGSIICGHDYTPYDYYPDITENIKRLEEIYNTKVTIHAQGTTVWSMQI